MQAILTFLCDYFLDNIALCQKLNRTLQCRQWQCPMGTVMATIRFICRTKTKLAQRDLKQSWLSSETTFNRVLLVRLNLFNLTEDAQSIWFAPTFIMKRS
jgi:hypothetical protein